jgi:hypothetical protein
VVKTSRTSDVDAVVIEALARVIADAAVRRMRAESPDTKNAAVPAKKNRGEELKQWNPPTGAVGAESNRPGAGSGGIGARTRESGRE